MQSHAGTDRLGSSRTNAPPLVPGETRPQAQFQLGKAASLAAEQLYQEDCSTKLAASKFQQSRISGALSYSALQTIDVCPESSIPCYRPGQRPQRPMLPQRLLRDALVEEVGLPLAVCDYNPAFQNIAESAVTFMSSKMSFHSHPG